MILADLKAVACDRAVVLPLHPRTRAAFARKGLLSDDCSSLCLLKPVGYLDMLCLERNAVVIAPDSGCVQKEANFHGVPCVTLRTETEWVELLPSGASRLCAPNDPRSQPARVEMSRLKGFPPRLQRRCTGMAMRRLSSSPG